MRIACTAILLFCGVTGCGHIQKKSHAEDCWGVYSWASWKFPEVTRETCPDIIGVPLILKWKDVEPREGEFRFDELLGKPMAAAADQDYHVFLMMWAGPAAPDWIYEKGVPLVKCERTINPRRQVRNGEYPYYFNKDYIRYFFRMIRAFGDYAKALPEELRERIVFVQIAEGSTGDGYCYKGDPLDDKYAISRDEWRAFRVRTWEVYQASFQREPGKHFRFMVNADANRDMEWRWLMANQDDFGVKQGMFSHGYHISNTVSRLRDWRKMISETSRAGKRVFARGEQDAEWKVCGWSSRNKKQALYWSAIFATHCGIDVWNLPSEACKGDTYSDAIRMFNKYAGHRDPSTSPAAFCALRRGVDVSDTELFPEETFGKATKRNVDRYVKIAAAFSAYGAYQGDPKKAVGGGMINRQRDDYNDAGWEILPGNYWRFLEQIDPDDTSVAYWHVSPQESIYGRFARGFEKESGKTAMYFDLDDAYFSRRSLRQTVNVKVTYLDRDTGSWSLIYHDGRKERTAYTVTCEDTGRWREITVTIDDAIFNNRLAKNADLILEHIAGTDTIFHMIELER